MIHKTMIINSSIVTITAPITPAIITIVFNDSSSVIMYYYNMCNYYYSISYNRPTSATSGSSWRSVLKGIINGGHGL